MLLLKSWKKTFQIAEVHLAINKKKCTINLRDAQ